MAEHFKGFKDQNQKICLVKHRVEFHSTKEESPSFSIKVLGSWTTSTKLQIAEALEMERGDYDNLLNSKTEWGMNSVPRQRNTFKDGL